MIKSTTHMPHSMPQEDAQRRMLNELGSIVLGLNKEIESVKAEGVPKDIRRKLVEVQSRMKKLITEIRDIILRQTSLDRY